MGLGTMSRSNLPCRIEKNFLSLNSNCLRPEPWAPESVIIIPHICSCCTVWSVFPQQIYDRDLSGLQLSVLRVVSLPAFPPAHRAPAPQPSPQCRRALLAPDDELKARASFASLHAKCLILHAKRDLFFIGGSKSCYVSPNTVSCIAPITDS